MKDRGNDWLKELKKKTHRSLKDLIAMHRNHDPFYCGTAGDKRLAEWFAGIWERWFKGKTGIHLRKIHYTITSGDAPMKPSLTRYALTKRDWTFLVLASKKARYMGLVPADAMIDQRNPEPIPPFSQAAEDGTEPRIERSVFDMYLPLPAISLEWGSWELVSLPPQVHGYAPHDSKDRAFNLALCIEKSTMDSILGGLCRRELGVTYIGSEGFQSISTVVHLLKQWQQERKPVRVFYISDADSSGKSMPRQVARQFEFWKPLYAPDLEMKLKQIAITAEQIRKYKLPPSPDGKIELDALETLHPGELRKIVVREIEPYLDPTIRDRLQNAEQRARSIVREEWQGAMGPHDEALTVLRRKAQRIVGAYQKQVVHLQRSMMADLEGMKVTARLATLKDEAETTAESFDPQLPGRPEPKIAELDESKWLFDSGREYLEQLKFYKKHRGR